MPWSLEKRDSKWCVIKESDGSVSGCHDSRADAIKQQRALYANESRMASMYDELDAQDYGWEEEKVEETVVVPGASLSPFAAELVGLILKDEREKSLTASLSQTMGAIEERMASEKEERAALVAALSTIGQPVINVAAPEVTVEAAKTPEVKVEVAAPEVTVQPPEVNVNVPPANITVRPEITLPSVSKTVTFERDPLTGQVSKAEVTEA